MPKAWISKYELATEAEFLRQLADLSTDFFTRVIAQHDEVIKQRIAGQVIDSFHRGQFRHHAIADALGLWQQAKFIRRLGRQGCVDVLAEVFDNQPFPAQAERKSFYFQQSLLNRLSTRIVGRRDSIDLNHPAMYRQDRIAEPFDLAS